MRKFIALIFFGIIFHVQPAYAFMTMEEGKQSIEKHCSDQWPSDFQMLTWCLDREEKALIWFQESLPKMSLLEQAVRSECLHEWSEEGKGTSWSMGKWCYEREMKAWQSLADNPSTAERAKQLGLARIAVVEIGMVVDAGYQAWKSGHNSNTVTVNPDLFWDHMKKEGKIKNIYGGEISLSIIQYENGYVAYKLTTDSVPYIGCKTLVAQRGRYIKVEINSRDDRKFSLSSLWPSRHQPNSNKCIEGNNELVFTIH